MKLNLKEDVYISSHNIREEVLRDIGYVMADSENVNKYINDFKMVDEANR